MSLSDWTKEFPQEPGYYLWWEPDARLRGDGFGRVRPGRSCIGVASVAECEPGFGWKTDDGKILGISGVGLPKLTKGNPVYWQPLPQSLYPEESTTPNP